VGALDLAEKPSPARVFLTGKRVDVLPAGVGIAKVTAPGIPVPLTVGHSTRLLRDPGLARLDQVACQK
jgi:hypothetical protein